MAAELCTPASMAFVVRHTGGVICAALPALRLEELALPQMLSLNQDPKGTAFTVTVDAAKHWGVSTGISAADRAATMRALATATAVPADFVRPGHVFPLRAKAGGVLERDGHTEATVDLCRLAGLQPAGLLSELVTADSVGMARMPEIVTFCAVHKLMLTTIEDLICYRLAEGV
jgi:3,4-dihydroxy 2-butanone 4-phosphate synthase/GTP cyclohydrolase II